MLYKVQILTNYIVDTEYEYANPLDAIKKFIELINLRKADSIMTLVIPNNEVRWMYDIRPETAELYRWKAKDKLIASDNIMPVFYETPLFTKQTSLSRQALLYKLTKGVFIENFNTFKIGRIRYYDVTDYELYLENKGIDRYL